MSNDVTKNTFTPLIAAASAPIPRSLPVSNKSRLNAAGSGSGASQNLTSSARPPAFGRRSSLGRYSRDTPQFAGPVDTHEDDVDRSALGRRTSLTVREVLAAAPDMTVGDKNAPGPDGIGENCQDCQRREEAAAENADVDNDEDEDYAYDMCLPADLRALVRIKRRRVGATDKNTA